MCSIFLSTARELFAQRSSSFSFYPFCYHLLLFVQLHRHSHLSTFRISFHNTFLKIGKSVFKRFSLDYNQHSQLDSISFLSQSYFSILFCSSILYKAWDDAVFIIFFVAAPAVISWIFQTITQPSIEPAVYKY